jgi:hypothetical protein
VFPVLAVAEERPMTQLQVAICGGGRTGHLNAVLFAQRPGVHVSLLTRSEEVVARLHDSEVTAQLPDGSILSARPDLVTTDPAAAVAMADMVVVTVPAHARPAVLEAIAPHLPRDKPVYVGAIPGFCGFDWLAAEALHDCPNAVVWGMKDVPHTAFALDAGRSVRMGGAKQELSVGTHRRESAERRRELLSYLRALFDAPVALLDDYMEITLTPGNPIMHSSVIYGLIGPYGQWYGRPIPEPLCWWRDCPELGAYFLERMDEESLGLCRAVERRFGLDLSSVKQLRQEIVEAYGDQIADASTMLSILRTNRAYDDIPAPLVPVAGGAGYAIDRESRAFHEDVAYGLALLVEMARRLDVRAPYLEEVFAWNVSYMGGLRGSSLAYFPSDWPGEPQ